VTDSPNAPDMSPAPSSCGICCHTGGGTYRPFEGVTRWFIGLDSNGQAHYACEGCAPSLFNVRPL
jgi:hypothetical protein